MKIGKLTVSDLEELVFKNLKSSRKEVVSNPEIGGDCAVIDNGDKMIYLSSDPITGTSKGIGKLSVNINCNDIATAGVEPLGLMVTILAPEGTTRFEIEEIMKEMQEECDKLRIDILGGHTEITQAVNRIVVSTTAIGLGEKEAFKQRKKVVPGDEILITKGIGIEGTGIIAFEKEGEIKEKLGEEILAEAKKFLEKTSVVKEGLIGKHFSKGMHDVTEGGLLGAVWEISEFYNVGIELEEERLVIGEVTKKISELYQIDPLRLISSGTMLMIISPKDREELVEKLSEHGIESFIVGKISGTNEKVIKGVHGKKVIEAPESDELYKVL